MLFWQEGLSRSFSLGSRDEVSMSVWRRSQGAFSPCRAAVRGSAVCVSNLGNTSNFERFNLEYDCDGAG